jgi:hypothetical protein
MRRFFAFSNQDLAAAPMQRMRYRGAHVTASDDENAGAARRIGW